MAMYDSANYQATDGDWQVALARYNGGPYPNDVANAFGTAVYGGALAGQQEIGVKVDVTVKDERGNPLEHKANTTRKPVAHQSYHQSHHTPPTPPKKH